MNSYFDRVRCVKASGKSYTLLERLILAKNTIFINGRFLSQQITGVQRFAIELLTELDAISVGSEALRLVLLVPRKINLQLKFNNIEIRVVGWLTGNLWEQLELPFYSRGGVLLNLCNAAPLLKRNQIATIHDVVVFRYPSAFSFFFRNWYKIMLRIVAFRARKILTDSKFSRREIEAVLKVTSKKIEVIPLGREHILRTEISAEILSRYGLDGRPFLLAVSSLNPYKNFQAVIRATEYLDDLDFDLVIAGGTNPKVFCAEDQALPHNVKYLGYVTDVELRALYGAATAFVFPSLYEGFGLPPLEAMTCGCPVVMSNRASLPEVGGDAVLYVDPSDIEGLAHAIHRVVNDKGLRCELRELGFVQSRKFSWRNTAVQVQQVLKSLAPEVPQ